MESQNVLCELGVPATINKVVPDWNGWAVWGGVVMRVGIFLLGIFLFFSTSAGAQAPAGAGAGLGRSSYSEYAPWQIAIGYQYTRHNLFGTPFNTHGVYVSLVRYFGRWFGVEAQVGTGFLGRTGQGTNPPNLGAKSLLVGGGPRLAYRNHGRYEPWAHFVCCLEHFRFPQVGMLGSNSALAGAAGGGLDVHLNPRVAFRFEADALGSRFFSTNQRSFQAIAGIAWSF